MPVSRSVSGEVTARYAPLVNVARGDTVRYAISAYGYLVPRGHSVPLADFADLIEQHYDTTCPQNAAAVRVLRECNEPVEN